MGNPLARRGAWHCSKACRFELRTTTVPAYSLVGRIHHPLID